METQLGFLPVCHKKWRICGVSGLIRIYYIITIDQSFYFTASRQELWSGISSFVRIMGRPREYVVIYKIDKCK